jgi:hypothetical protein
VDLLGGGRHSALEALVVEHQGRPGDAVAARERGQDLLGPGHLRHELGVDEARGLHAREPCGGEPLAQLGPHGRREHGLVVLEPVARADVAEGDLHWGAIMA